MNPESDEEITLVQKTILPAPLATQRTPLMDLRSALVIVGVSGLLWTILIAGFLFLAHHW